MRDGTGWGWVMGYGVFTILLAMVAFLWPVPATIATVVMAGLLIALLGAAGLIAAFRHRGRHRTYDTIMGVLSLIVGIWMVLQPVGGAVSLTIFIAVWLAIRGVAEIYWGLKGARRKGWVIALGAINLLLAALIFGLLPVAALTLPGTILAISFLFTGIGAIGAALAIRRGEDPRAALPV